MDKIILPALFLVAITLSACKKPDNKMNQIKDRSELPNTDRAILNFADQKELDIETKYFTIELDSETVNRFGYEFKPIYRFDTYGIEPSRYWARWYNGFYELRFHDYWYEDTPPGYHYLIGMKKIDNTGLRAFYIKWRNRESTVRLPLNSDIGKNTVYIESNLPDSIINHYYQINCRIEHSATIHDNITLDWNRLDRFNQAPMKIVIDERYRKYIEELYKKVDKRQKNIRLPYWLSSNHK